MGAKKKKGAEALLPVALCLLERPLHSNLSSLLLVDRPRLTEAMQRRAHGIPL